MTDFDKIVVGPAGTPQAGDYPITGKGAINQPVAHFESETSQHQVMVDSVITAHSVAAYADLGATRAVARHLGASYGYPPSTAQTLLRSGEFQTLRGAATLGGTWGIEIGVHSEVAGDGVSQSLGAYIASSHGGWLNSGVRNDVGVLVTGEDGWYHGFRYLDTNGTVLFDVDQYGTVYTNSFVKAPNTPRLTGHVQGVVTTGNDAILQGVSQSGFTTNTGGAGGGTRVVIPETGLYQVEFNVNVLESNTQVYLFSNGASTGWGAAGNAAYMNASMSAPLQFTQGQQLSLRCNNGSFGQNPGFSHFAIRRIG